MTAAVPLSDFEEKILANVERTGCHINFVFDPEGNAAPFGYSVGFTQTLDEPEVIVFGFDGALTRDVINDVMQKCREGLSLTEGTSIEGVLSDHPLVVRTVDPSRIDVDHFNSAIWFERRRAGDAPIRAVQLVWPDPETGLFPWDPEFPADLSFWQPAFYEARAH